MHQRPFTILKEWRHILSYLVPCKHTEYKGKHIQSHQPLGHPDTWSHLLLSRSLSARKMPWACTADYLFHLLFHTLQHFQVFFSSLLKKRKSHCQSNSTAKPLRPPWTYIHPAEASSQSPKMTLLALWQRTCTSEGNYKEHEVWGDSRLGPNLTLLLIALYPGGNELTSASPFLICKMSLIPIFKGWENERKCMYRKQCNTITLTNQRKNTKPAKWVRKFYKI